MYFYYEKKIITSGARGVQYVHVLGTWRHMGRTNYLPLTTICPAFNTE